MSFTVKAYTGDNKTLLAFNFSDKKSAQKLAGFTIQCTPKGQPAYYLFNELQFQDPSQHAQVATEPANSTVNAPIHKFRWVHVTGSTHQGTTPAVGSYTYTVTPRYFDKNASMQPLDSSLSESVTVNVGPFSKKNLSLGFTRGYMQSEAFAHHFGVNALIRPKGTDLIFDTSQEAGTNPKGQKFTYADEYEWMGSTARVACFDLLNEVLGKQSLHLDMFAYDLNEPDVVEVLLKLAKQGRIRVILDNATLHHNSSGSKPEDKFTAQFQQAAKSGAAILRGKYGRFAHDKVLIVSNDDGTDPANAVKVLTGSTNFSVTGLYVNANHVLIFDDAAVAKQYSAVFNESWNDKVSESFSKSALASTPFQVQNGKTPPTTITFSPHTTGDVTTILGGITTRIMNEAKKGVAKPSVLFAVMQLTGSPSPVYATLQKLHAQQSVFSYGISDSPGGVTLYAPGKPQGVLVTGKPGQTTLPPPFDQVPVPPGHEIHDKFVVCGFNGDDPVVYCGSSNLATGGEANNGDNLIAIHDADVATCFAIEALLLVDHYSFLDRYAAPQSTKKTPAKKGAGSRTPKIKKQPRSKKQAAIAAGMFLSTDDSWTASYYDPKDLHCMERLLFG
ncbi:MAG TPA: phospholipase D-like domain-containing protein [Bryobacteraceae bacterium]|nr:phospholipase D-like domain-containing protein [Bryobacteraceae bacterium]